MCYIGLISLHSRVEPTIGEWLLWINYYDFVVLVKEVRIQLDLSQEDLAREIGVSFATVNRWENRRFMPSKLALKLFEIYCDQMIKSGKLLLPDKL
jgi:putative transcriptional regulator